LSTYQIPYLLLDRLSEGAYCRENGCPWTGDRRLRPFRDITLQLEARGTGERVCAASRPTGTCAKTLAVARGWQLELFRMIDEAEPAS
jgi:hypothetical protein